MKINENLRELIFDTIKKQISTNDPPETRITYKRLRCLGYNEMETNQLIGQCLTV